MPLMGYENSLYVNTGVYATPVWEEVDLARDVTSGAPIDKIDVTSRRTARRGQKAQGYGLAEFTVSFESLVPAPGESSAAFDALRAAQRTRSPVDVLLIEGGGLETDGLEAVRAVCGVFGGERGEPLNEAATLSFELSFMLNDEQDAPVFGATNAGAFVPDP